MLVLLLGREGGHISPPRSLTAFFLDLGCHAFSKNRAGRADGASTIHDVVIGFAQLLVILTDIGFHRIEFDKPGFKSSER